LKKLEYAVVVVVPCKGEKQIKFIRKFGVVN